VARKGSGRGEFREHRELAGVERKREKRGCSTVWSRGGVDEHARSSATSRRPRAAKQLRGWARGGAHDGGACRSRTAARDPPRVTVAEHIPSFSVFFLNYFQILNRSQFLVKTKVPQNFALYKTYLRTQSQF